MKYLLALGVAFTMVGTGIAGNPTGTWKSTITLGNQSLESTLKLRLDSEGPRLTGACFHGSISEGIPLTSTRYQDSEISFSVRFEEKAERFTIQYNGTHSGDTITGKAQFVRDGQTHTGEWIATRQK